MKRLYIIIYISMLMMTVRAQSVSLESHQNVSPKGYKFWIQLPADYDESKEHTPLVIFLHGASLCGGDVSRAIKYGPINAGKYGLVVNAIILAPHNPGGSWSPSKINDILEWVEKNYEFNHNRVYVIGMSLGGYGTIDFAASYPDKVAAAMALCGGTTLKNPEPLGQLPLWIIHGTADKAVNIKESKAVVDYLERTNNDTRLRYEWIRGADHGSLARYMYLSSTYDWLFSHTLLDPGRPVDRSIEITPDDLRRVYRDMKSVEFDE